MAIDKRSETDARGGSAHAHSGWLESIRQKLGPGVLFAASSIGTSHLIQSTRAGGDYGLALWSVILLAAALKYPAFLFGAKYAAVTGRSLLHHYVEQGWLAIAAFAVELAMLMFIATGALAIITGGLFNEFTGLGVHDLVAGCGLLALSAVIIVSGRYHLLERIVKFLVGGLAVFLFVAALLALPSLLQMEFNLTPANVFDRKTLPFVIALAGWMPTSMGASVLLSLWVCAKSHDLGRPVTSTEAQFDFQLGYLITLLLAFAFMILGAVLLFGKGIPVADGATAFARQLIGLFVQSFGAWSYPFFAFAVLAVMWSTLLAILDACPRAIVTIIRLRTQSLKDNDVDASSLYRWLVALQCIGAIIVLVTVMRSFKAFIDFATSITWLIAPFLAWLNHRAVFSDDVGRQERPGRMLWLWSVLGISSMVAFALIYLYHVLLR